MKEITFEELEVPQDLGTVEFQPVEESVKKFAYAVEDETGWFLGDPKEGWIHPVFLSNYLWWPEGFYLKEPGAIGHFTMFEEKYGHLIRYPFLHAKTNVDFINPFRIDKKLQAGVKLVEKYHKRDKDFIVIEAMFQDEDGTDIARYRHTAMINTRVSLRMGGIK